MPADGRLARVHLHGLGDRARLIGQLREGELELSRIDPLGLLTKEPLTEHIELMPERHDLLVRRRELLLEGRDEGARRDEVADLRRAGARRIHCLLIRSRAIGVYARASCDAFVPLAPPRLREVDPGEQ